MQGQCGGPLNDASVMASRLERCCSNVSDWCARKRLQLNAGKTDVLWFGSAAQLRGLRPDTMHITINQSTIKPATVVRDLGVFMNMNMINLINHNNNSADDYVQLNSCGC